MCQPRFWKSIHVSPNGINGISITGIRSDDIVFSGKLETTAGTGDFSQTALVEFINKFEKFRSCLCTTGIRCALHQGNKNFTSV